MCKTQEQTILPAPLIATEIVALRLVVIATGALLAEPVATGITATQIVINTPKILLDRVLKL